MCVYRYRRQVVKGKHVTEDYACIVLLCAEGHRNLHLVACDDKGVGALIVPKEEPRWLSPLAKEYPTKKAIRSFRSYGARAGITKTAKELLKRLESTL